MSVGTSATLLAAVPTGAGRGQVGAVLLYPDASADVFVGGSSVSTSTGLKLKAAGTVPVTVPMFGGDALYGIVATGSATVGVLQT